MSLISPAPWPRERDGDLLGQDYGPAARSTTVWPRTARRTKSCTECQRRKQKCNKMQPCSHCKRRFPEPVCEYGPMKASAASPSADQQTLHNSPQSRPLFFFPVSRPASTPRAFHFRQQTRLLPNKSPKSPPTLQKRTLPKTASQQRKIIAPWSDIGVVTEYPVCSPSEDGYGNEHQDVSIQSSSSSKHDADPLPNTQTPVVQRSPRRRTQTVDLRQYNTSANSAVPSPWLLAGPLDAMVGLPIVVNKQNAMLIHTFGEVLYHLKGSFDGIPDHDNPFLSHYVPWCVQSPLLVQTSLYISAQPLAERHFLDETTTMRIKVNAIHTLNEYLRSTDAATCAGDEAMGAVAQFISIEFYYGTPQAMQAHLQGLRQMVQLRGGFAHSQVGALVTKVALVGDAIIAIAMEAEPILQEVEDTSFAYVYDELPPPTFNLSYSSPLLAPRLPFGFCVSALGLHPATAWLLDEMVFLVNAVLDLPAPPSDNELTSLKSTAAWILERIEQLPVDSPDGIVPPAGVADGAVAAGTETEETASTDGQQASPADKEPPKPHSLLPRYPKFSSDRPTTSSPPSSSPLTTESDASTTSPQPQPQPLTSQHPPAGPLYTAVRLTASLYTRAILERRPLSEVCADEDALAILAASWRVPLDRWRGVVGVFLFIVVAIVPTLHQRSDATGGGGIYSHIHTRFAKSILQIGLMNVALVDWPACREMMSRALRLQRWLRAGVQDAE